MVRSLEDHMCRSNGSYGKINDLIQCCQFEKVMNSQIELVRSHNERTQSQNGVIIEQLALLILQNRFVK